MKTDMGRWADLSLGNDKKQEESWRNRPEAAGGSEGPWDTWRGKRKKCILGGKGVQVKKSLKYLSDLGGEGQGEVGTCRERGEKSQEREVGGLGSTDKKKGNHTRQRPKPMKIAAPSYQDSSPQIGNTSSSSGRSVCFCLWGEPNCS